MELKLNQSQNMISQISEHEIKKIIKKIELERGLDCSNFRHSYLARRILTRINAYKVNSVSEYLRLVDEDPKEYERLINTLTVNVSRFFRDNEVYLKIQEIIEEIIGEKYKRGQGVFRVWSAGCSTGEEPYSIATIIHKTIRRYDANWLFSIYASDVDRKVLDFAQKGTYPIEKIDEIPEKFRNIAINCNETHFQIKPAIKNVIRFNQANLFSDQNTKFFDLILCRNVIIYFSKDEHMKLYKIFHDALNNKGILIIGRSEKLLRKGNDFFEPLDAINSIYLKKGPLRTKS